MDQVANSGNDEFYTPSYAIEPLLKYLPERSKVWCPFDTMESLFVRELFAAGHGVMYSHIDNGTDFFEIPDEQLREVDYVVSNPPYSVKTEVLKKLFGSGARFAMLVGVVGLFESQKRFEMFRDNEFEVMYLNRRVSYYKNYGDEKPALNPPFSSVYVCSGLLPRQVVFEEVNKTERRAK